MNNRFRMSESKRAEIAEIAERIYQIGFEDGQASSVEDETIKHEGLMLRKVDSQNENRMYVRFPVRIPIAGCVTLKKIYKMNNCFWFTDDAGDRRILESIVECNKNIPVDFFEVVQTVIELQDDPTEEPVPIKSANQQRAELIQRARELVEGQKEFYEFDFVVNTEKLTIVALVRYSTGDIVTKGIAKCNSSDVFNADIGEAIALARALEIDIPGEFLKAVQPDEVVVGMVVYDKDTRLLSKAKVVISTGRFAKDGECHVSSISAQRATITDDTNAEYADE